MCFTLVVCTLARMKAAAAATREVVSRASSRHETRKSLSRRGEGSTNPPSTIWRFPMLWKTDRRGHVAISEKLAVLSRTRRGKSRPISASSLCPALQPPVDRLIWDINSARVTKNHGGVNHAKIYDDPSSLGFPRMGFHVATYFPPCYAESLYASPI